MFLFFLFFKQRNLSKKIDLGLCRLAILGARANQKNHAIDPDVMEWLSMLPVDNTTTLCKFLKDEREYCTALRASALYYKSAASSFLIFYNSLVFLVFLLFFF